MATQRITWSRPIAADASKDGTGGTLIMVADAVFGSIVSFVRVISAGSTAAGVFNLWINNGSMMGNEKNNTLFESIDIPACSGGSANRHIDIPLDLELPPGYKLTYSLGSASDGFLHVTAIFKDKVA